MKADCKINKIAILGGGESGIGAAILAKKMKFNVFLSDSGKIRENYRKILLENKIIFEEDGHSEHKILDADWVIKSPGIPKKASIIEKIKQNNIRISSELEFAYNFTDSKIIAVTGSNGKTTTTSLIYHILKNDGYNVGIGGNIGKSFAYQVATEDYDYYVLEVSSFQLDDIQNFKPHISLLLNISPDHLDQYNYDYHKYALAKFKITENQDENNFFIYNRDDEMSRKLLKSLEIKSAKFPFSLNNKQKNGGYYENGNLVVKLRDDLEDFAMESSDLSIIGYHNVANSLAASIAGKILNISNESIRESLMTFQSIPHRLEKVATIDGITYINDSKATNVNAAYYSLETVKTPVVWIVGGIDKGNDYREIENLVNKKVRSIVCLGLDNDNIINFFQSKKEQIFETSSMQSCIELCKTLAKTGDTVLLAPCCSSFDLFENYEDRGNQFRERVLALKQNV